MNGVLKIWGFLNSPHPIPGTTSSKKNILTSAVVGILVALILYFLVGIIAPKGFRGGRVMVVSIYGIVSFIATLMFLLVIPSIVFQKMKDEKWTLLKEIGYILSMVVSIAMCNFFIAFVLYPSMEFSWFSFYDILKTTLLVAIIPVTSILAISMYKNEKKYSNESQNLVAVQAEDEARKLTFTSSYAEDDIQIDADSFYFAEAESNYVSFYFKDGEEVKHLMLRTTLKKVSEELDSETMIVKSHRSFIINFGNSSHFTGNSQGYVVHFNATDKVARVSRSFTSKVKELLLKKA